MNTAPALPEAAGERIDLLAQIRLGTSLKKVDKVDTPKEKSYDGLHGALQQALMGKRKGIDGESDSEDEDDDSDDDRFADDPVSVLLRNKMTELDKKQLD